MSALEVEPIGEPPECLHCHKVPPKLPRQSWAQWESLRFCDRECRAAYRMTIEELIAEVDHLLGSDSLTNIARRLGYLTARHLARRLWRSDRKDLARLFDRRDQ